MPLPRLKITVTMVGTTFVVPPVGTGLSVAVAVALPWWLRLRIRW